MSGPDLQTHKQAQMWAETWDRKKQVCSNLQREKNSQSKYLLLFQFQRMGLRGWLGIGVQLLDQCFFPITTTNTVALSAVSWYCAQTTGAVCSVFQFCSSSQFFFSFLFRHASLVPCMCACLSVFWLLSSPARLTLESVCTWDSDFRGSICVRLWRS